MIFKRVGTQKFVIISFAGRLLDFYIAFPHYRHNRHLLALDTICEKRAL